MPTPAEATPIPDRDSVLIALRERLRDRLARAQEAVQQAFDAATHEESRAENKYDTRALEQSYLSAGQTERVTTLRRQLTALHHLELAPGPFELVVPGALVEVELEDARGTVERTVLVLPLDVGEAVEVDGATVHVVAVEAPLARALHGREAGDEVRVGPRLARVVSVR
ncbi:MAG: hypothetical protein RIT45_2302 [Pseudomonadota bacterium]|jgi:transcription elongation GreA/GreB family factor